MERTHKMTIPLQQPEEMVGVSTDTVVDPYLDYSESQPDKFDNFFPN